MKILTILALIFSTSLIAAPREREWRIIIENEYKRDKEIWGTYRQVSEKTSVIKHKKSISEKRNPSANMMLKRGKMILIQPVENQGITSYKVREFKYKRSKGKKYNIMLKGKSSQFLELYKNQVLSVLKKNKLDHNLIDWNSIKIEDMKCKSKRSNFSCKIPLVIKQKTNS